MAFTGRVHTILFCIIAVVRGIIRTIYLFLIYSDKID